MRWQVERSRDIFEDVVADYVKVEVGCLVFRNSEDVDDQPCLIFAAGQWITVCEAAE